MAESKQETEIEGLNLPPPKETSVRRRASVEIEGLTLSSPVDVDAIPSDSRVRGNIDIPSSGRSSGHREFEGLDLPASESPSASDARCEIEGMNLPATKDKK